MSYSHRAWRGRYDRLRAEFDRLFQVWAKDPKDEWKRATATRFSAQEGQWGRWIKADCETRVLGNVRGSIYRSAIARCETRHIASRTLDLAPQLDAWEGR
jgi:hypothetical protein